MPSVDVIIKSSRRPWALDRLLRSLDKFLVSRNPVKIYCVDDRTDQRYLTELTRRYPNVDFSTRATWKENDRALGTLPYVEAWQRAVAQSQAEYVLVLEDDQWLGEPLNLDVCTQFMSSSGSWSLVLTEDASRLESAGLFPSERHHNFLSDQALKVCLTTNHKVKIIFISFSEVELRQGVVS